MAQEKIDAIDIFDWDYLVQIGTPLECNEIKTLYQAVLIPMKVVSDSDLIPVTRSDAMPVTVGAKRRWRRL